MCYGRTHQIDEFPIVLAGTCGGALKTGFHYRSATKENTSHVQFSILRAMGLPVAEFGADEGRVTQGFSRRTARRLSLFAVLLAMGCTEDWGYLDSDEYILKHSHANVLRQFSFTNEGVGVAPGFDLDGLDSPEGDVASCGHGDLQDPDGRTGVDNQLAKIWVRWNCWLESRFRRSFKVPLMKGDSCSWWNWKGWTTSRTIRMSR